MQYSCAVAPGQLIALQLEDRKRDMCLIDPLDGTSVDRVGPETRQIETAWGGGGELCSCEDALPNTPGPCARAEERASLITKISFI